ncbi:MAG: 50S ribosomal protein L24 [bacterium]|nr:50S ribosomal protein L24 [bacterium]
MAKVRLKKGDTVEVITGDDRGKTGKVLEFNQKKDRVYVQGVNMRKKHRRANPQANQPGGIIEAEGPIHPSNVRLVK